MRPALCHDVVYGHRTDDRREPSRLRPPRTQQCDDIASVDMKILVFSCRVAAQIGVCRTEAAPQIVDMAEQMPLRVLRSGTAEIGADAPIGQGTVGNRPVFYRQATQQGKAAATEHLNAQLVQHRSERWQREIRPTNLDDVEPT